MRGGLETHKGGLETQKGALKHSWWNSLPRQGEDRECAASTPPFLAKELMESRPTKASILRSRNVQQGFGPGPDAVRRGQARRPLSTSRVLPRPARQPGRRRSRSGGPSWGASLPGCPPGCGPQALGWEGQGRARPRPGPPGSSPSGLRARPSSPRGRAACRGCHPCSPRSGWGAPGPVRPAF